MTINYISEYYNNCDKETTLELCNLFVNNPHVVNIAMFKEDNDGETQVQEEFVSISFSHYMDFYEVVFNVSTQVGQLYQLGYYAGEGGADGTLNEDYIEGEFPIVEGGDEGGEFDESDVQPLYKGIITVKKLQAFLKILPHVMDYVEDEAEVGVTVH